MATQVTNQGEGGALYRAPPLFFRGDSKEADRFLLTFKGWKAVNSSALRSSLVRLGMSMGSGHLLGYLPWVLAGYGYR
jgi:hypothetical protein